MILSRNEINKRVAQEIMGLQIVGECFAWNPEGSGVSIRPPSEAPSPENIHPVYLSRCGCDYRLDLWTTKDEYFEGMDEEEVKKAIEYHNTKEQAEFDEDQRLWGHGRLTCLDVVPNYCEDIQSSMKIVNKLCHPELPWAEWTREQYQIDINLGLWSFTAYTVPSISSFAWGWSVGFRPSVFPPDSRGAEDDVVWAREETLSQAICMAALRIVEFKREGK